MNEIDGHIQTLAIMEGKYAHIRQCDAEWEAVEAAVVALRAQLAKQQNAPLTLEELRGMDGEAVYISGLDVWVLVNMDTGSPVFVFRDGGKVAAEDCYEVDYIAYRRPPKQ